MGLELNKVTASVDALGASAARRITDLNQRLPAAKAMLSAIRVDDELMKKIAAARAHRWAGAIPSSENINAVFPLPPHPARLNVIAADGSQIYPTALLYTISSTSAVLSFGTGEMKPRQQTPHRKFFLKVTNRIMPKRPARSTARW